MQFTINAIQFEIEEFHDGWAWVGDGTECKDAFLEPYKAQQDAIRYVAARERAEADQSAQAEEDERYGSYEKQVEAYWKSTRL